MMNIQRLFSVSHPGTSIKRNSNPVAAPQQSVRYAADRTTRGTGASTAAQYASIRHWPSPAAEKPVATPAMKASFQRYQANRQTAVSATKNWPAVPTKKVVATPAMKASFQRYQANRQAAASATKNWPAVPTKKPVATSAVKASFQRYQANRQAAVSATKNWPAVPTKKVVATPAVKASFQRYQANRQTAVSATKNWPKAPTNTPVTNYAQRQKFMQDRSKLLLKSANTNLQAHGKAVVFASRIAQRQPKNAQAQANLKTLLERTYNLSAQRDRAYDAYRQAHGV